MHKYSVRLTRELLPYATNSRTHSESQVKQIASSINEWGFTNPVLIDEKSVIIAGHCRVLAANLLELNEVPCITLVGLTDSQKKAYVIADNKLALNADWDNDLLAIELATLNEMGFNLELLGFGEDGLQSLNPDQPEEGLIDDDEVPSISDNPVVVLGDLWEMEDHRLLCGDSRNIESVERLCEGQLVDLWMTDPPYNVNYHGGTADQLSIANDNFKKDSDFIQFLRDVYSTADAVMKPGAVFYIWHADSNGHHFRNIAIEMKWKISSCLIWSKNNLCLGRSDYHWQHEPCLYGWKEGAAHQWSSDRKQSTIMEFNKPTKNTEHPTMKPVEIFEYQISNNSKSGDIILDSFAGSGTTVIACQKLNRQAKLIEIDPVYCDVIIKRWQEFTGKNAVNQSGKTFNELRI